MNPMPRERVLDPKKPVPTPRSIRNKISVEQNGTVESNTLKRLIDSAKKSAEKIVLPRDRQNTNKKLEETVQENNFHKEIDIFSSIRFNSPINTNESIYNNVQINYDPQDSSDDSSSLPPPSHPPPPLRLQDETVYDAPSSVGSIVSIRRELSRDYENRDIQGSDTLSLSSISTGISELSHNELLKYECVYPCNADIPCPPEYLSSSNSWTFYDQVPVNETSRNSDINSINSKSNVYENSDINFNVPKSSPVELKENNVTRITKSVIMQFDPLQNRLSENAEQSDVRNLESIHPAFIRENSLYNNIESSQCATLPPIPIRFDSLPDDEIQEVTESSRSTWFDSSSEVSMGGVEPKKHSWLGHMKEVLEKAPSAVKGVMKSKSVVRRSLRRSRSVIHKRGMLYKVQSGPVEDLFGEYSGRWCILQNSYLKCYSDNSCSNVKENISFDQILSIQIIQDTKYVYDNDVLHCFQINLQEKIRGGHVYGSRQISERRSWMQCLAEGLTDRFSPTLTTNYSRMGWAFLRKGVTGEWMEAWILLSQRTLFYAVNEVEEVDLRKGRCINLQKCQESDNAPQTSDYSPVMLIDYPFSVLYLRMWTSRETKTWHHVIKHAAHNNGALLKQQQLTKDDIPVIVEKCINFIFTYGSTSEGIYRRAGSGKIVSELITRFMKDAFSVQLTIDNCSEYEVATVLKRFFRDLPEPILNGLSQYFFEVAKVNIMDERVRMYKAGLDGLSPIDFMTIRKLLGHLHFISTQSSRNLMTVANLSAIWGPTLLCKRDVDPIQKDYIKETEVVSQLISLYCFIFPDNAIDVEKDKLMLKALEAHNNKEINKNKAGDLKIWIYLLNKEGRTCHVSIGPNKTAQELCAELSKNINLPVEETILEEVVLNGRLCRPLHYAEKVLDVVLQWSYWDEIDRKDNHLVLIPVSKYVEFKSKEPPNVSDEIKYADSRSRFLKTFLFKLSSGKLCYYKDKYGNEEIESWKVEDLVCYLGHELKRNSHALASVTFFDRHSYPNRTKSSPYFGNILVWNDQPSRTRWFMALLNSKNKDGIFYPPQLVNLWSL